MKPRRPWLPVAVKAYQMLKDEHFREASESRLAVDRASAALAESATELTQFCQAWAGRRAALDTSHGLEQAYQQFHAHLQRQQDDAASRHRALEAQFAEAQDRLRESRGKHRVLERLEDIGKQQRNQHQRKQELLQTAESWCLDRYGKGPRE